jgi:hypothetical protein
MFTCFPAVKMMAMPIVVAVFLLVAVDGIHIPPASASLPYGNIISPNGARVREAREARASHLPKDARAREVCASHAPKDARVHEARGHAWFHAPEDARPRGRAWNIMAARVST